MKLDLMSANRTIGTLDFPSDASRLRATSAADGLTLWLPAVVAFHHPSPDQPCGYLTGVRVTLFHGGLEVGVGDDPGFHWGEGERPFEVGVRVTAAALAVLERQRNASRLELRAHVKAKSGPVHRELEPTLLGLPMAVEREFQLEFDRDRWVDLLRKTGWGESVIVEIPLPPKPEPAWDRVWTALRSAREAFDRGGPGAWQSCVTECRNALAAWEDVEKLDAGGPDTKPDGLTRTQRLDVLRRAVRRYAHEPVHSVAHETTRAEAAMVLAALAAMLGVRSNR